MSEPGRLTDPGAPGSTMPPPDPDAYTRSDVASVQAEASAPDDSGGVKERASQAASEAADSAKEAVATAKEQASNVVGEVRDQARTLIDQTQTEVRDQVDTRTKSAAEGLRSLQDQVRALADGRPHDAGPVGGYANEIQQRIGAVADRLESGGAQGVLDDITRFARQRPAVFLLAAGAAGFLAGRFVRSQAAVRRSDAGDAGTGDRYQAATPWVAPSDPMLPGGPLGSPTANELDRPGAVGGQW